MNHEIRGKRGVTDVISLPALEWREPKVPDPASLTLEALDLGDIYLCLPLVEKQVAPSELGERVQLLVVHSFLHLLGYDHEKDAEWETMLREEEACMKHLGKRSYFAS